MARMPPTARAAFSVPRPSGPVWSTSRARLGKSAWWAKPSTSAPPVSIIRTSSMRSRFTASTKLVMPRHIESDPERESDPEGSPFRTGRPASPRGPGAW